MNYHNNFNPHKKKWKTEETYSEIKKKKTKLRDFKDNRIYV